MARPVNLPAVDILDIAKRAKLYLCLIVLALWNLKEYIKMSPKHFLENFMKKALKSTKKYPNAYWRKEEEGIFGIKKEHAGNRNYDHKYDRIYKDWEEIKTRKKTKTCMKQRLYGALRKSPDFDEVDDPTTEDRIYKFTNLKGTKTGTAVLQPRTDTGSSCESQDSPEFQTAYIPDFNVKCEPPDGIECLPESSHQNVGNIQLGDHTYSKILCIVLQISNDMAQPCFPHPNQVDPLPDPHVHQLDVNNLMQHQSTSTHTNPTSVSQPVSFTDALAQESFVDLESLISAANIAINQPNMETEEFLSYNLQESMDDSPSPQVPGACDFERQTLSPTLYDSSKIISFGDEFNSGIYKDFLTLPDEDIPYISDEDIPKVSDMPNLSISDEDWAYIIGPSVPSMNADESPIAAEENEQNCEHPLDDSFMEEFMKM